MNGTLEEDFDRRLSKWNMLLNVHRNHEGMRPLEDDVGRGLSKQNMLLKRPQKP